MWKRKSMNEWNTLLRPILPCCFGFIRVGTVTDLKGKSGVRNPEDINKWALIGDLLLAR